MVTCFECDNDRSKIDDRSLNSPINRFRFGSRFSALVNMHYLFLLQAEYMKVWQGTETELTKAVRNLLGHLGTAALWTNYSLKGARGKQALDQTKVYDLIKSRWCFLLKHCSVVLLYIHDSKMTKSFAYRAGFSVHMVWWTRFHVSMVIFSFIRTEAVRRGNFRQAGDMSIRAAITEGLKHMPGRKGGSRYRVCEPFACFVCWNETA